MNHSFLASQVKIQRTKRGMSQDALAEQSGLSQRTIQRIENGESHPTGDTIQRIAAALGISPEDLVEWTIQEDNGFLVFCFYV